jgi:uncharacterized protein (DUF1501 family)
MQKFLIVLLLGLTAVIGSSTRVMAIGALAIGSTGNVAVDGFAIGGTANKPTRDEAIAAALKTCRSQPDVPKAAARCRIVRTFRQKCYAAAFDPKHGTPGVGWGLGPDRVTAIKQAMKYCQASAGKDRAQFCKVQVDITNCDTHE